MSIGVCELYTFAIRCHLSIILVTYSCMCPTITLSVCRRVLLSLCNPDLKSCMKTTYYDWLVPTWSSSRPWRHVLCPGGWLRRRWQRRRLPSRMRRSRRRRLLVVSLAVGVFASPPQVARLAVRHHTSSCLPKVVRLAVYRWPGAQLCIHMIMYILLPYVGWLLEH